MLLRDKIAVITGGGQGIGREIALEFARQGADVVLAARTQAKLDVVAAEIRQIGRRALAIPTDLRNVAEVDALRNKTLAGFGRCDVLVNNSGIAGPVLPHWEIDPADWQNTFDINVNGVFYCNRAFIPGMLEHGSGNIIIIGSMTGKRPMLHRTPYTAAKMALVGMVRTLAWDLADSGVRANLISPGAVAGERMERSFAAQGVAQGISTDQAREQFTGVSPQKMLTDPKDVAHTAVFLASDMSGSITGEDVNVSAGVVMY
ncbi:MAG: SDR family oxidoreductase [Chloroflexota bacterium]